MLTILLGTDWVANRDAVLNMLADDISEKKGRRILLVPELISHDMERRLCRSAGDTSSRFAEVVSFSRLTRRICDWKGCGLPRCLDNGGRLVAMAAAARQLHSQLKAYAALETKPEFLTGLIDVVDEFKRCCISAEDLRHAASLTEGSFAQKLEELSMLLDAYDGICAHGLRDPRDQLIWGLEQLQDCDFAQSHVFYIDGFPDFTRQNMAIIAHMIEFSPHVVISLNCDELDSDDFAFEKASDTAKQLVRIATQCGTHVDIQNVKASKNPLRNVSRQLFQGKLQNTKELSDKLFIAQAETIHDECMMAADRILSLVHNGVRYHDISVVCPNLDSYGNALNMHFQLCGIPSYLAGTEDILENTAISTVLTGLECAIGGFEGKDVLRYLKSALSPLDMETCDKLENYAIMWSIQGKKWLAPWTAHPDGLQENWLQDDILRLEELNDARKFAMEPLLHLANGFRGAVKLEQQVDAIFTFLNEIHLDDALSSLALQMNDAGDNRSAQILNQHWDILLTALEQLQDVLGDTAWDDDSFLRLFRLLLSQYDVGTIPPVLDTVTIGPVSAMRCQQQDHLIVIGACEGSFPSYGGVSGVLSDQERNTLRMLGIPLTGGASEGLQIEFSEIYGVFCGAEKSIYISCLNGQESFVFRRLCGISGKIHKCELDITAASVNPNEAAAYLCRLNAMQAADELGISDTYLQIKHKQEHHLGRIQHEVITQIYGKQLNLSASQVDKQADCRLAYFLKYGLRAKECKTITIDPAEFGTYVHAVLEETARQIRDLGGFKAVTLEQTLQIAQTHSDAYIRNHFSQIDSERIAYLFRRNNQELMMVVEELWAELQNASFVPIDFEVAFGDGEQMHAIPIDSTILPAKLRGFVDRVDVWQEDNRKYYRVVDYKTGKKDFDYCDVFNGLGLQMLLYLFALQDQGEALLGEHPMPAGVQYFPARVPILNTDSAMTDEEAAAERQSQWKRKGLILEDEDVLHAMDHGDPPTRLSCKRKKDGTITGDIASKEQFGILREYVFRVLANIADEIASGEVDPNPYTRGNSHNACRFCPYGIVCHATAVEGRRNYKAMSAQKFWEEVGKELEDHG